MFCVVVLIRPQAKALRRRCVAPESAHACLSILVNVERKLSECLARHAWSGDTRIEHLWNVEVPLLGEQPPVFIKLFRSRVHC